MSAVIEQKTPPATTKIILKGESLPLRAIGCIKFKYMQYASKCSKIFCDQVIQSKFSNHFVNGIQGIWLVYQFSKLLKEYMVCEFAMCIYVCIIKRKSKDTHFNLYLFFSLTHNMRSEIEKGWYS